uniref:Uncharacterized protein n=1 Tax=Glossina austeni TaxID=7395 RepID=A0A1A9VL03_GLOAU
MKLKNLDLDLVKSIPVKDCTYFSNRNACCDALRAYNVFLSDFNSYLFPTNRVVDNCVERRGGDDTGMGDENPSSTVNTTNSCFSDSDCCNIMCLPKSTIRRYSTKLFRNGYPVKTMRLRISICLRASGMLAWEFLIRCPSSNITKSGLSLTIGANFIHQTKYFLLCNDSLLLPAANQRQGIE